jgi:ABC-type sugar transport system ATPase subunit
MTVSLELEEERRAAASPGGGTEPQAPAGVPQLLLDGVEKSYGGVRALRGAGLRISRPGVVHGLIGANGSGKSTMLGIISGQQRPDRGRILLDGRTPDLPDPHAAVSSGIAMVSQETALAPELSITENVLLGGRMVRNRISGIDWAASRKKAAALLGELGVGEDPSLPVRLLRPDRQQMVEIARAISLDARILILDEPTSALNDDEVEALFGVVRRLKDRGVSTIFVSHRLPELIALTDEITVLRDGRTVGGGSTSEFDADRIVELMVGRASQPVRRVRTHRANPGAPASLELKGLSAEGLFQGIDLQVEPGEIVGLAGMEGAGRSDLMEAVFGIRPVDRGEVLIDGARARIKDERDAIGRGIGYLPSDRKVAGLVLQQSIAQNLTMVTTRDKGWFRAPGSAEDREVVARAISTMNIVAPSPATQVGNLSGGNQQKVAIGKWIAAESRIFLLDEPTRGVDVAAKREIHKLLFDAADRGAAIVVSSSETEELLELCDRIVVLYRGSVFESIETSKASEEILARYAGGNR